jgi:hypothetical protein
VIGLIRAPTFLSFLSSQLCDRLFSHPVTGSGYFYPGAQCDVRLHWDGVRTLCCFLARYLVVKEPNLARRHNSNRLRPSGHRSDRAGSPRCRCHSGAHALGCFFGSNMLPRVAAADG